MAENRNPFLNGASFQDNVRRSILHDIEAMSRRALLRRSGQFATASALFAAGLPLIASAQDASPVPVQLPKITSIPDNLKGSGQVTVASYGGTFQDAQREAYFK